MVGPGTLLAGRYRLEQRVGAGGMGEVWRATHVALGRTVAVKVMLPELVADPDAVRRFRTEARAMGRVRHPGVAAVYDFRDEPAGAYLVMELIEGEPLSQRLGRDGKLPPATAMELVAQAARALQAAHDQGLVHRDVKPANLLLRPDGTVVLTDFGIARLRDAAQLTGAGTVLGTPSYLAPEQALGQPATPQSDVYALGVVAYECLAGARPFVRDNPFAAATARVKESPPPLPDDIPAAVRTVVDRAMAREPAHRWPTAAQLATACDHAAAGTPLPALPGPTGAALPATTPLPTGDAPPPPATGVGPTRRSLLAGAGAGIAGIAITAVAATIAVTTATTVTTAAGPQPREAGATPTRSGATRERSRRWR